MAEFERGDIVVYCFPEAPQWHGTLAIVDKWDTTKKYQDGPSGRERCYPVWILDFLSCAPNFPYINVKCTAPWLAEAWEKVGHIDLPE